MTGPTRMGPRRLGYLLALLILVFALWPTPFLAPLKTLVVFFHEASHALTAVATGGVVIEMEIDQNQGGHVRSAVELIRRARPAVVAIPYWRDQHPDHEAASRLLTDAAFRSGLRRYAAEGAAWKPEWVCHYFINDAVEPSFVIDVSDAYPRKQQALECHRSQFRPVSDDAVPTRLTGSGFRRMIEARDAHLGALAGVAHVGGVIVKEPVERPTLFRGTAGVPRKPRNGRTS